MVRYLTEQDVRQLLTMPIALDCVEQVLKAHAEHRAIDVPRARIHLPGGTQHVLQAAAPELNLIGFKYYYTRPGGKSFYVHLIDTKTARLEAIIEAVWMSMIRTGAASAIATRCLAREDAAVVGQIGAGFQGTGQLEAVCRVRKIRTARVYARTRDKLTDFCEKMSRQLEIEVVPAPGEAPQQMYMLDFSWPLFWITVAISIATLLVGYAVFNKLKWRFVERP